MTPNKQTYDQMIPVRVFPKYSRKGASSRLRIFQFFPDLEQAGFKLRVSSLFKDAYLETVYSGERPRFGQIVQCYFERLRALQNVPPNELVLIEGELFPWIPVFVERFLLRKTKYIVDYDDAIFHRYDLHRFYPIRYLLSKKIDRLMRDSALVIVGNDYLGQRARNAGAQAVVELPTVVDLTRYPLAKFHSGHSRPTIGWIGTPITWKTYGQPLFETLMQKLVDKNIRFVAIGASPTEHQSGRLEFYPWSEASEVDSIAKFTIGLMPLEDTPWARGKCGYKLIQYMACGVPVIASPVGVNCDIVQDGENGNLAAESHDWIASILTILENPSQGLQMGLKGREAVQKNYSLQSVGPQLVNHLLSVANKGPAHSEQDRIGT